MLSLMPFLKIKSNQSGFLLMNLIWGSWSLLIMFNWYWWLHPHSPQFPSLQLRILHHFSVFSVNTQFPFPLFFTWKQCSLFSKYFTFVWVRWAFLFGTFSIRAVITFSCNYFLSLCYLKHFPNIDGKNLYYSSLFQQLWFSTWYMQMFRFFFPTQLINYCSS